MNKIYIFLVLAIVASCSGLNIRPRRQVDIEDNLEDRYGWEWRQQPGRPTRPRPTTTRPWGRPTSPWGGPTSPRPTPGPTPNPNGSTTMSPDIQECIRQCPVTAEYNPVCGTNNITYDNPGRLTCAQSCGINVRQARESRCPAATTARTK